MDRGFSYEETKGHISKRPFGYEIAVPESRIRSRTATRSGPPRPLPSRRSTPSSSGPWLRRPVEVDRREPGPGRPPPEASGEHDDPPAPDEAVRLLAAAAEHSCAMEVLTWLALVTGARRSVLATRSMSSPEGLPLILFIPDVWTLERRYLIADVPFKKSARRQGAASTKSSSRCANHFPVAGSLA
jgi:hypothetical protein